MIASRASEYGMQALVYLQEHSPDGYVSVRQIAKERGISPSFLAKVLKQLVEHGILTSQKGPGGGVRLGKPASQIRLIDVIEAIDGLKYTKLCAIGYPGCGQQEPCPLHDTWGPIRDSITRMLSERSLESLAGNSSEEFTTLIRHNPPRDDHART